MAPTISGDADERFEPVRSALATNFDEDAELGASAAVVHRGRLVCDVWGGSASVDGSRPWESDTIVNLWSTTKTVAALVVLLLHDRGVLSVDDPIAVHWPEIRRCRERRCHRPPALTHLAGLHEFRPPLEHETMFDWDECCSFWPRSADSTPGEAFAYHAFTQGFLLGEVVRRVTEQTMGDWIRPNSPNRITSTSTWAFPSRSGPGLPRSTTPPCRHRTWSRPWPTSTRLGGRRRSFPRRTATATLAPSRSCSASSLATRSSTTTHSATVRLISSARSTGTVRPCHGYECPHGCRVRTQLSIDAGRGERRDGVVGRPWGFDGGRRPRAGPRGRLCDEPDVPDDRPCHAVDPGRARSAGRRASLTLRPSGSPRCEACHRRRSPRFWQRSGRPYRGREREPKSTRRRFAR